MCCNCSSLISIIEFRKQNATKSDKFLRIAYHHFSSSMDRARVMESNFSPCYRPLRIWNAINNDDDHHHHHHALWQGYRGPDEQQRDVSVVTTRFLRRVC